MSQTILEFEGISSICSPLSMMKVGIHIQLKRSAAEMLGISDSLSVKEKVISIKRNIGISPKFLSRRLKKPSYIDTFSLAIGSGRGFKSYELWVCYIAFQE